MDLGTPKALGRDEQRSVAVYRRLVSASIERVWENVLDWEHLPYLHHDSFASIELLSSSDDGWRALVGLTSELGGVESEIEVVLDRGNLRYTTATVGGMGAGSEIVTSLAPSEAPSEAHTRIEVDFRVPGIAPENAAAVGSYYRKLYARLWDQDEAMMVRRERVLGARRVQGPARPSAPRAPVPLGTESCVRARLPFMVEIAGFAYRVLDVDGDVAVHEATCPHLGGPLDAVAVEEGCITCPWHGYRFDVRTGRSADGRALRLAPAPSVSIDRTTGEAYLVWDA